MKAYLLFIAILCSAINSKAQDVKTSTTLPNWQKGEVKKVTSKTRNISKMNGEVFMEVETVSSYSMEVTETGDFFVLKYQKLDERMVDHQSDLMQEDPENELGDSFDKFEKNILNFATMVKVDKQSGSAIEIVNKPTFDDSVRQVLLRAIDLIDPNAKDHPELYKEAVLKSGDKMEELVLLELNELLQAYSYRFVSNDQFQREIMIDNKGDLSSKEGDEISAMETVLHHSESNKTELFVKKEVDKSVLIEELSEEMDAKITKKMRC